MRLFRPVSAGLLVLAAVLVPAASAAATPAQLVCRLADARIDEASGIAPGLASPGVLYVQNDSGDSSRFFALNAHTCQTAATITVGGARNVDWEDIAVGRDASGVASVWLADIGDNDSDRSDVAVYRVAEPRVSPAAHDRTVHVEAADVWRLRYPGGPANAESFAVGPDGTGYVVTKSDLGNSVVYRLPAHPDAGRVQTLHRIASLQFTPVANASGGPLGRFGGLLATGAAMSPDGHRFVVRTYTAAEVWTVARGNLAAALRTRPTVITLPDQPQGEGIAFDGPRLLVDSEGTGSAIYAVGLPRAAALTTTTASHATTASATTGTRSSPSATARSTGSPAPKGNYGGGGSWIPGIVVFGLAALLTIGWWVAQRGARGRRAER